MQNKRWGTLKCVCFVQLCTGNATHFFLSFVFGFCIFFNTYMSSSGWWVPVPRGANICSRKEELLKISPCCSWCLISAKSTSETGGIEATRRPGYQALEHVQTGVYNGKLWKPPPVSVLLLLDKAIEFCLRARVQNVYWNWLNNTWLLILTAGRIYFLIKCFCRKSISFRLKWDANDLFNLN